MVSFKCCCVHICCLSLDMANTLIAVGPADCTIRRVCCCSVTIRIPTSRLPSTPRAIQNVIQNLNRFRNRNRSPKAHQRRRPNDALLLSKSIVPNLVNETKEHCRIPQQYSHQNTVAAFVPHASSLADTGAPCHISQRDQGIQLGR
jgi:hypothetical protein